MTSMGIILAFLFILQMISFFVIALLYMKIAKFKDLERKQQKLMDEMDDTIAAYLAEIKEENDRLIDELSAKRHVFQEAAAAAEKDKLPNDRIEMPEQAERKIHPIPVNLALRSYQESAKPIEQEQSDRPQDDRSKAIQMYKDGKSIEEIAKTLGKGKTEVELIVKFG